MKIYTKRGDRGETDLLGGPRVPKDHPRVEAYGAVDELTASIGVCMVATRHEDLRAALHAVQERLFALAAHLASPDAARREKSGVRGPGDGDVAGLEAQIDSLEKELEPLRRFIIPGGSAPAAAFHVARTVCRRAERRVVAVHREHPLGEPSLRFLNRLSDLLFVMARVENLRAGVAEIEWEGGRR